MARHGPEKPVPLTASKIAFCAEPVSAKSSTDVAYWHFLDLLGPLK
jgi:hypothetical protein